MIKPPVAPLLLPAISSCCFPSHGCRSRELSDNIYSCRAHRWLSIWKTWKCQIPLERKLKQSSTSWKHWQSKASGNLQQVVLLKVFSSAKSIGNNKNFQIRTMNCNYFSYSSCKRHLFCAVSSVQKPLWNVKTLQKYIKISFTLLIWSFWFTTLLIHESSHF